MSEYAELTLAGVSTRTPLVSLLHIALQRVNLEDKPLSLVTAERGCRGREPDCSPQELVQLFGEKRKRSVPII